MKRRLLLMMVILLILTLAACGEPPTVNSDFSGSFTVRYGNADYNGTLTKDGGALTIVMTAPYTVEGMTFTYQGDALRIGYRGHETETTAGYLAEACIPSYLHNTLPYLPQAEYVDTTDGVDRFTLPTPSGSAAVTASSGTLKSLTVAPNGLAFRFEGSMGDTAPDKALRN